MMLVKNHPRFDQDLALKEINECDRDIMNLDKRLQNEKKCLKIAQETYMPF